MFQILIFKVKLAKKKKICTFLILWIVVVLKITRENILTGGKK